ncbi:membrane-spanning 4-domains subfamily A member 13 [Dasypus novemcinctus]|uniref:membrane-spanning 4-domains subfamily A member 13 n=1 Tax=Dasypus novemcinctus TaxID=9361 RepID=UPI00265EFAAF|nr:membrane-spanning 4-domains subfamily A member 13 [Dasypus novemcinctus]
MAPNENSKLSTADGLVLGVIQILIGIFHVLMWYFLLISYMGQKEGFFGAYEPVTYKAGCALWGAVFIISGFLIIKVARQPTKRVITGALVVNIICIIASIAALVLTVMELSHFRTLSYRNYGQAKIGREVSRVLMFSYPLVFSIAFVHSFFIYIGWGQYTEEIPTNAMIAESIS